MWEDRRTQPSLGIAESGGSDGEIQWEVDQAWDALVLVEAAQKAAEEAEQLENALDKTRPIADETSAPAVAARAKADSLDTQLSNVLRSKDTLTRLERITLYIRRRKA
jgi:NADPH-dependent ferric siderophore reductase